MPKDQRESLSAEETRKMIELQAYNAKIGLSIWDIPGQSSMMALNRMYIRDT